MKKIPTIFIRDWNGDRSKVTNQPNPDAQWVFDGEGTATRKFDGTACLIDGGNLFARYDVKPGKTVPVGFRPAQEAPDEETGHFPGWVPVDGSSQYKWHRTAFENSTDRSDGTYEACGPHFQGNPEKFARDVLVRHGIYRCDAPRTFEGLRDFFSDHDMEGLVWHHPDGRMAKIKARDFGLRRAR